MDIVVGATGFLGSAIVRALRSADRNVRALIRTSSDPEIVASLEAAGAETAVGDVKDPASLVAAMVGVDTVLITTSSTRSRGEGDSIDSVDRQGNLNVVAAAKAAGVQHIVFVSFPHSEVSFPLQDAKRAVEAALESSGIDYTILHPPHFWEVWCSAALGFDHGNAKVQVFGDGDGKHNWISLGDVATAAVACLDNPAARNKTFNLGGPEALSQNQIIARFEAAKGRSFEIERVPAEVLQGQVDGSGNPLEKSFAALMLITAQGGWEFDSAEAKQALDVAPGPISEFIKLA